MTATHKNFLKTTISAVASAGLGALTISTASSGYRTFAAGDDGKTFDGVTIKEGTTWEVRDGCVYTHSGTSLSRGTLMDSSTGSAITFTSAAVVEQNPAAAFANSVEYALAPTIAGLGLTWVSVSAIDVSIGAAYIESLGRVYSVPSAISLTGLSSLTASTLYHVYLYDNAGTPAAEVVTTAPASPFAGTARSKTSDTTRRYLGSVYVNASQQIVPFQHHIQSGLVVYRNAGGVAPSFRVLAAGSATTETAVSCGSFVPSTSRDVLLKISNTDATANVLIGSPDEALSTSIYFASIAGTVRSFLPCPTNASQQVAYLNSAAASGAFIDLLGYWYAR